MNETTLTTEPAEKTARRISSDWLALAQDLQKWNGKGSARHQRFLERFQKLQGLFDQFAEEVRGLDAQQRRSLRQTRESVGQCYREFCELRDLFSKEHPEPEEESFPEIPEEESEEEPEAEAPEESEESQEDPLEGAEEVPAQDEAPKSARKKRRRSRYPPRYTSPQQELRDAAAHAGMRIHPDQPVTPDEIQHYRRQLEEQHRREAEAAAAARARQQEIFQRYKDRMEQSAQFERPNYHHIDMSPEGFSRSDTSREPESDPHPSESIQDEQEKQRGQPEPAPQDDLRWQQERVTRAQRAAALAEKQEEERQQYVLKSVTQTVGGVSYVMESAARRQLSSIPYKTGNDALIGLAKGTYYVSTAAGVGSALLRSNPAASLDRASRTVTSAQLAAHSNDSIRRCRELKSQIQVTQQSLSQLSSKPPDKRTAAKQAQLRADLSAMRQEKLRLDRQIPRNQQVNRFRHERTLDREIMESLRPDGKKVPSSPKRVNQLSQQMLKEKRSSLEKKYGTLAGQTAQQLNLEIQHLTRQGKAVKEQIRALEAKGSALTQVERKLLLELKAKRKDIGTRITTLTGARHGKEDLAYIEGKLGTVLSRAQKRKQQLVGGTMLLRNFALRPLDENKDTQGLRYGLDFVSSRRNRRILTGAAKLPYRAVKKTVLLATPAPVKETVRDFTADVSNRFRMAKQQQMRKVRRGAKQALGQLSTAIVHATPQPIQSAVNHGVRGYRKVRSTYGAVKVGIQNKAFQAKVWFANTPLGRLMTWQQILNEQVAAVFKAAAAFAKSASLWFALGVLVLILLAGILSGVAGTMTASSSSLILSPAETTSGKINLAPYSQVIRSEMTRFNGEIANIMSRYENNDAYDNVTMQYSGQSNNSRELLSMMAVRMGQALDMEENPAVKSYLVSLYRASHSYEIAEHRYTCEGCKERLVQKVVIDPVTGQPTIQMEKELYCPGHTDVTITVTTVAFDAIFEVDDYWGGGDDWEGWTEETIAWCKLIYDMDWEELYEGVEIAQDVNIGGITASANELEIWNFLMDLTGNTYGAAGLMGNLYAESGLSPTNLQDSYEASLGYDDQSYTNAVDNGTYQNFVHDQAGYGLAQWTYFSRKQALLTLAKGRGTSIGSLATQLEYLARELDGGSILADLRNASSVREASDIVMIRFENPADQSERAKALRASYCEYYYNKMTLGIAAEGNLTQKQMDVITIAMNSASYGIPANPGYCQQWAAYVYAKAGLPIDSSCCAYHSGVKYGVSDDWNAIPPGAAVYGYSGSQYGHVGIYVGNGLVYHNVGGVAIDSLADWVKIYKGFAWGWLAGSDLTTYD